MIKATLLLIVLALVARASGTQVSSPPDTPREVSSFASLFKTTGGASAKSIWPYTYFSPRVFATQVGDNKFNASPCRKNVEWFQREALNNPDFCRKFMPDSVAAKYNITSDKVPHRYPAPPGLKTYPPKGCDNFTLAKLSPIVLNHCEEGPIHDTSWDSLCFNKKCISAMRDLYVCGRNRFAFMPDICLTLDDIPSFEHICPKDSYGYKIFSKLDCSDFTHFLKYPEDYSYPSE
ncbi:hypothetical protein H696_06103 [Fonticula alba]|uniref:Uncharacterized protein n=1 Tax=Fonticula alba TaxID=691883 RepID=A0A058YZR7_FONAL|nr:hypothetical protein H696_06103 [Fonticula alba]KCV67464.1 hypothetical protein H696_06103 [Fonticula alba]|eukprot:XP_009498140.1 hypothetical protein H696_06103 [Fonticula alba]